MIPRVVLVIPLLMCSSAFGECRKDMDQAVGIFIDEVFTVSRIERWHSPEERQIRYQQAVNRLVAKAIELKIEPDPLKTILQEYLDNAEGTSAPPSGWDSNDRKGNLHLFHEMAKVSVQLDLKLISYGRKFCIQEPR
jgi:hypothetical protein